MGQIVVIASIDAHLLARVMVVAQVVVVVVVLLQIVVIVLLLQAQLVLLLVLLVLLHQLLLLTKIEIQRTLHRQFVFDELVDIAVLEFVLQRVQIQIQVVRHHAGHDAVVVQHAEQVTHDLRRRRRRLRLVANVLRRTRTLARTGHDIPLSQSGSQQT